MLVYLGYDLPVSKDKKYILGSRTCTRNKAVYARAGCWKDEPSHKCFGPVSWTNREKYFNFAKR